MARPHMQYRGSIAIPALSLAALVASCGSSESLSTPNDVGGPQRAAPAVGGGSSQGAAPAPCSGSGGGAGPGDLFACDNIWYRDVSNDTAAPESAAIVSSILKWGTGAFSIDFSFHFMTASPGDPRVTFTLGEANTSDKLPVPIPPGGALEGQTGYQCAGGGGCRLLVVDDANRKLFEVYGANNASGGWYGGRLAVWDLTRPYGPEGRGYGCASADPAGLPVTVGLVGLREARATGTIAHALRFGLPADRIRKGPSYVFPATHGVPSTTSPSGPPFGTRLRLKAAFDEKRITEPGGKLLVRALKKHGMILADVAPHTLMAEEPLVAKRADPSLTWSGFLSESSLSVLEPTDFEVVGYSPIHTETTCTLK